MYSCEAMNLEEKAFFYFCTYIFITDFVSSEYKHFKL